MTRRIALLAGVVAFALGVGSAAFAQERGEGAELSRSSALVGDQVELTIRVFAPEGATVELTPGTDSWNGIELVRTERPVATEQRGRVLWEVRATVAGFFPGQVTFAPSVAIISGTTVEWRTMPAMSLAVVSVLPPDAELVLRPLAPPVGIEGAEPPWVRPAIAVGVAGGVVAALVVLWFVARTMARALGRRRREPSFALSIAEEPALDRAERVLESDPVAAYRVMSSVVKTELARRYGLRATALTTNELRRRLEVAGADRWEARLVGGLLEECDAVIYAGYRPASERRAADMTMAREIVEVG